MNIFTKIINSIFRTSSKNLKTPTPPKVRDASYWDNKWTKSRITYKARGRFVMDIRNLILNKSYILSPVIDKCIPKDSNGDNIKNCDEIAIHLLKYVISELTYKGDQETYSTPEFWQDPEITLQMSVGDCFAGYEEIYTQDGIKKIKDIKEGDLVLSYNFTSSGGFVYKPVSRIWSKGFLEINRVFFRNGQYIDVSSDHPMWSRVSQTESRYDKVKLSDIDLSKWWKRKVPIAINIPYTIIDVPHLTRDICFVIGHFLAEGWNSKGGKVGSSGYDLIENIIPILERENIPFTESRNSCGCPMVNFLKSDFKELLKTLKNNSFDIHLPEYFFHLPKDKLEYLLDGFFLGDGHNGNYPDKRGYTSSKQEVYSTSSEQFASDIQRIGLQLGRSFHIWKQEHHGGCGNKPIYRITYNPNSCFLRDHGYDGISEVSISHIEKLCETEMYDLTVQDTHTVVMKNGIITHQCEDGGILLASLMRCAGIPSYRVKLCAGWVKTDKGQEGHAYVIYLADDDEWYVLDWCYWPNESVKNFLKLKHNKQTSKYKEIWWTANDEFTWAQTNTEVITSCEWMGEVL